MNCKDCKEFSLTTSANSGTIGDCMKHRRKCLSTDDCETNTQAWERQYNHIRTEISNRELLKLVDDRMKEGKEAND